MNPKKEPQNIVYDQIRQNIRLLSKNTTLISTNVLILIVLKNLRKQTKKLGFFKWVL